jgi:ligand-binding sensor domain-containing protein
LRTGHRSSTQWTFRDICLLVFLAACATFATALDPHKDLGQYGHRGWQTDSGLPQNTVHAIVQTRDGYLWLAAEGGLVRFDEVELRSFTAFLMHVLLVYRRSFLRNC